MQALERVGGVELDGPNSKRGSLRAATGLAAATASAALLVACSASRHRATDTQPTLATTGPTPAAPPQGWAPLPPTSSPHPMPVPATEAVTRHWISQVEGRCAGDNASPPDDHMLIAGLDGVSPAAAMPSTTSPSGVPSDAGTDGAATSDAGAIISNAARVVASMREEFRACYKQLLRAEPMAAGRTRFLFHVNCRGTIVEIHAAVRGLNPWILECMSATAWSARFEPPQGNSARIVVPVTFVRQNP